MVSETAINQDQLTNLFDMAVQIALPHMEGQPVAFRELLEQSGYHNIPEEVEDIRSFAEGLINDGSGNEMTMDDEQKAATMQDYLDTNLDTEPDPKLNLTPQNAADIYDMAMQIALPAEQGPIDQFRDTLLDIGYKDTPETQEGLRDLAQEILDRHGGYATTKDAAEKSSDIREFFSNQGYDLQLNRDDVQPDNSADTLDSDAWRSTTSDVTHDDLNNILEAVYQNKLEELKTALEDAGFEDVPDNTQALQTLANNIGQQYQNIRGELESADTAQSITMQVSSISTAIDHTQSEMENEPEQGAAQASPAPDQKPDAGQAGAAGEPLRSAQKPDTIEAAENTEPQANDAGTEVTSEMVTQVQSYLYALGYDSQLEYTNSAGEIAYIDGMAGGSTQAALEKFVNEQGMNWNNYADLSTEEIVARLQGNLEQAVANADRAMVYENIDKLAHEVNTLGAQHATNAILRHDDRIKLDEQYDIAGDNLLLTDGQFGPETREGLKELREIAETSPRVEEAAERNPPQPATKPESIQSQDPSSTEADTSSARDGATPALNFDFAKAHKLVTDQGRMDEAHGAVPKHKYLEEVKDIPDNGYLTTVDAPGWFTGNVPVIVSSDGFVRQIESYDDMPDGQPLLDPGIASAIKQKIIDAANTGKDPNLDSFARDDAIQRVVGDDNIVELHGVPFQVNVTQNPNAPQNFEVTVTGVAEDFERNLNEDLQPDAVLHLADGRSVYIDDIKSLQKVAQGLKGEFDEVSDLPEIVRKLQDMPEDSMSAKFGSAAHGETAVLDQYGNTLELNAELAAKIADELQKEQGAPTVEPGRENEPSLEFG